MASNNKSVKKEAFLNQTTITAVSFGKDCKTVGESAFENCSELSNINNDNVIITIYPKAFTHTSIQDVTFNKVETIGNSAFEGCKCLKSITINNSCSFIGDYAFRDCEALTSVNIPNNENFKIISNGTFENCAIEKISIPKYITTIGSSAFNDCDNLSSVTFDSGSQVENIGDFAFNMCSSIKSISIPNTTTNIGYGAFRECKSITSAIIGNSVTTIQGEAFNGCIGITNINIPNSVTNIGKNAFARCSGLTTVSIGSGVTTIGSGAFLNCNKLKNVYINDIASWCNIDFTNIESNPLYIGGNLCLNNDPNTKLNITLPSDGVKDYAFYNCKNISNITIPNEFTSDKFGTEAFHGVTNHRVINLSNDITVSKIHGENGCVGENAQEIINAYNGEIHDEIFVFGQKSQNTNSDWALFKYLGTEEIYNSKYKDGLILPDKDYTYDINEGVFKDHTEIKNITISTDVTSIGNYTFNGCSGLTNLTINGYDYDNSDSESEIDDTKPVVYKMEMDGSESEIEPDLILGYNEESSNERIEGKGLFKDCELTILNLGRNISYKTEKEYGYSPFCAVSSLTTVNIGNDVTNINKNMFFGCRTITSVNIGNSVTSIGDNAFHNCSGFKSITIPNSVTSIGEQAFRDCSGLEKVYINNLAVWCKIKFVNEYSNPLINEHTYLYLNEEQVTNLIIPNAVKSIGQYAFAGAYGISSVTIPSSVTSIGSGAFYLSPHIEKVYINDIASWCKIKFENEYSNPMYPDINNTEKNLYLNNGEEIKENIIIPNGVSSIGQYAFYNLIYTKNIIIPNSVKSIGKWAFRNCGNSMIGNNRNNIKRIVIGNGVNEIGVKAFNLVGNDDVVNTVVDMLILGKNTPNINEDIFYCNGYSSIILINFSNFKYEYFNNGSISINDAINKKDAEPYGDFMFDKDDDGNYTLYGYMGDGIGALNNLPKKYNDEDYVIGKYVFYNCDMLESITIPNCVTSIEKWAFRNCSGLTSITIPSSVKSIEEEAFYGCTNLKKVINYSPHFEIKKDDKNGYVGFYADAENIINEPNGSIDNDFIFETTVDGVNILKGYNGDSITELKLPGTYNGETYVIGDYAFKEYTYFNSITIPNSVTSIGNYAFYGCNGLSSVTIPNSVTSIGERAFYGCSGLISVTIGKSVVDGNIGDYAFYGCKNLKTVINYSSDLTITKESTDNGYVGFYAKEIIDKTNESIDNNFKFKEVDGVNILYQYDGNETTIVLPETYYGENYVIGDSVFDGCSGLTSVTIGNSVTSIGNAAFNGCSGLTSVTIPNSITSIGDGAFQNCSGLTSVTIPNSVTYIGSGAFDDCSNLISITIPNSVTYIEYGMFSCCSSLTSVTIPNSVTGIANNVFEYCSSLTSVTIPESVTSIGYHAFQGCTNITSIILLNTTPPEYLYEVKTVFPTNNDGFKIYVPSESIDEYKNSEYWKEYSDIIYEYNINV